MAISTNGVVLTRFAAAVYNQQLSNATYNEVVTWSNTNDLNNLLNAVYNRDFATIADSTVANTIVTNLGLTAVAGLTNWLTAQITAAGTGKGAAIANILNGFAQMTSDATYGAAATAFNTKTDNAQALSQTSGNTGGSFSDVGSAVAGKTFTLTTSADSGTSFIGGSGTDTYNAVIGTNGLVANGTTLNPGDNLNGGTGTDTLAISISGTHTGNLTVSAVTLNGVETITTSNFQTDDAQNTTIDLANATGVTTIAQTSSSASGDTFFTSVKSLVGAKMENGAGDLGITYADTAVAGTADTQTLELNAVTGGTFTVAATATGGVETLAITSSGTARNVLTGIADATTTTKYTVGGTAAVTLGTIGASVTSLDASANTGGVTAILSTTATATVTGGAGNDAFTVTNARTTGSVVAGNGTDSLTLSDTITNGSTTNTGDTIIASTANGAKFTGFETLNIAHTDGGDAATVAAYIDRSQDVSLVSGITSIGLTTYSLAQTTNNDTDTATSVSFTNLTSAVKNLNISGLAYTGTDGVNDDDVTLTVAASLATNTTADSMTVTLGTATAAAGNAAAAAAGTDDLLLAVSLGNFETLNIVSQGAANTITTLTDAELTTLNLSGSKALTISTIAGNTLTTKIDASAMTANFTMGVNGGTTASTISGGSGNDSLVGGNKADTITGGAGNDSIVGAAGADSLNGGDGDDTFTVATVTDFTTGVETVVGGAGNDTLSIAQAATATTITAANLGAISGIETLSINSTSAATSVTLTDAVYTANGQSLRIVDGDLTTGGGTLTVDASALTAANSIAVTANTATGINDTLTGGAGNDTFTFSTTTGLEATDTVVGGAGTDTISLTATAAVTAVLTGVRTVENVVTTGTGGNISITVGSDSVIAASSTLTTKASSSTTTANTLTYDGSAVSTATKVQNVTGTAGEDTITGGAGNDIVSGGDAIDSITGGAGIDNLSGGAGNDIFVVGTAAHFTGLTTAETVAGGAGTDTLRFATGLAPTIAAADLAAISSIEKIETLNTATALVATLTDAVYTANGNTSLIIDATTMTTGDLTLTASGLAAANSVTVEYEDTGAMTDSNIVLGAGNDVVKLSSERLDDAATITGGTGNDTLTLQTGATATMVATITGFETINFGADVAAAITTVDANVASGVTFTVDGSALITTNALTFNGAAELDGKFSMTGGAAADALTGGALADTISGGAGADTITGSNGADSLSGGGGADVFVYTSASVAHSTGTAYDTITDFSTGTDKISVTLNYSAVAAGVDVNGAFVSTAGDLSAKRGEVVYDSATSLLYVNVNNDNLLTTQDIKIGAATVAAGDVIFNITGTAFGDTIVGGTGADTIDGGAGVDSITGGAGNDTITVANDDSDTIVFSSASTNGSDSITGFVATAGKDILYSRAFTFTAGTAADTALNAADTAAMDTVAEFGNNVVAVNATNGVTAATYLAAVQATDIDTTLFSRLVVLDIGATANLYYVENLTTADDNSVTITLLGTFTDIASITGGTTFVASNFDFIA